MLLCYICTWQSSSRNKSWTDVLWKYYYLIIFMYGDISMNFSYGKNLCWFNHWLNVLLKYFTPSYITVLTNSPPTLFIWCLKIPWSSNFIIITTSSLQTPYLWRQLMEFLNPILDKYLLHWVCRKKKILKEKIKFDDG